MNVSVCSNAQNRPKYLMQGNDIGRAHLITVWSQTGQFYRVGVTQPM